LKSFAQPPAAAVNVTAAVMVLLSNKTQKVPKDRSWKAAKGMMAKVCIYSRALLSTSLPAFPSSPILSTFPSLPLSPSLALPFPCFPLKAP